MRVIFSKRCSCKESRPRKLGQHIDLLVKCKSRLFNTFRTFKRFAWFPFWFVWQLQIFYLWWILIVQVFSNHITLISYADIFPSFLVLSPLFCAKRTTASWSLFLLWTWSVCRYGSFCRTTSLCTSWFRKVYWFCRTWRSLWHLSCGDRVCKRWGNFSYCCRSFLIFKSGRAHFVKF